jgi:primosomal protein N' (replication factor Y)
VPERCPACGAKALTYRGVGTQRVEAALAKCFPRARVLRMDADSTSRKSSHDDILGAFRRGEADILVGTQMIAKGLDFPKVTLVGVLNADSSLAMAGSDFRAAERTFQLVSQVAGRAGRSDLPGEVVVQTFDPSVPVLGYAARGDFAGFAADELKVREECFFPPYCHLAVVNFSASDARAASDWAAMYAASLRKYAGRLGGGGKGLVVGEALPSALEKADGRYRWQVVMRAKSAGALARAWRWISAARPAPKGLRVGIDIDAFNLV